LTSDIANSGTAVLTVFNPAPGGGLSNTYTIVVSTPNRPPAIRALSLQKQQGSPALNIAIASVSDDEQASSTLSVKVNGSGTANVNGVTISNLSISSEGTVTANILASCEATNATYNLTATDNAGSTVSTQLNVTVTANTPPVLVYANHSIEFDGQTTIAPTIVPVDNGSISSIVVQDQGGFGGSITVNNNTGLISISSAQPSGTHVIIIRAKDNCGASIDAKFILTVNKASTVVRLSSSADKSVFGQLVTLTATVVPTSQLSSVPSGSVTFTDGTTTLCVSSINSSGTAICSVDNLSIGQRLLTAVYDGDDKYQGYTSTVLSHNVDKAATSTTVSLSRNSSLEGEPVTFSSAVSVVSPGKGIPSGAVSIKLGTTNICNINLTGSGRVECNYAIPSAGAYSVIATYSGDNNFAGSASQILQQIVNPRTANLAVSISVTPGRVSNGTIITYTISVTNNGPANATQLVVTDNLPASVSFRSCSANNGGSCGGVGNNRTVTYASLASATTATVRLEAVPNCASLSSGEIINTVSVTSAIPEQNLDDNSATAIVSAAPGQARITLSNSAGAFDFGSIAINQESSHPPPSNNFVIENMGCRPLNLGLTVNRLSTDVGTTRITNLDDSSTFPIALVNDDRVETPLVFSGGSGQVRVNGGQ